MDTKKKHPMANQPLKIKSGSLAGKYFYVIDWLQRQYQGKQIKKIAKSHPELINPMLRRLGKDFKLDNYVVFGQIYPTMDRICVHNSEIKDAEIENVIPLSAAKKGVKNDAIGTGTEDNTLPLTGTTKPNGRSVSSGAKVQPSKKKAGSKGQADSDAGSTARGPKQGKGSDNK